jgi:hypothetical protein
MTPDLDFTGEIAGVGQRRLPAFPGLLADLLRQRSLQPRGLCPRGGDQQRGQRDRRDLGQLGSLIEQRPVPARAAPGSGPRSPAR